MIKHPIIHGAEVQGNSGEYIVLNPFDSSVAGIVTLADAVQAIRAIESADTTFENVKLTSVERSDILFRASELLFRYREDIASLIVKEAGKPIQYAVAEVERATFTFLASSKAALTYDEPYYPDLLGAKNIHDKKVSYRYFPLGVMCAITPFNFPLNLVAHKVAPAIASGNTIVLKPSPQTPFTSLLLADILKEAGLPDGWLSVIPCENDVAETIICDDRVKMVSFTGSADVGWYIKSLIPKKHVTLELGGNGAVIVDAVDDIDTLVKQLTSAAFSYAGQICISLQNLYIRDSLYESVRKRFVENAKHIDVGDPMSKTTVVGPMINTNSAVKAWNWVQDAIEKGAKKLCGEFKIPNFITPTILENVPAESRICCEEIFAPVVILHEYSDIDLLITQLNSSRYGLQTGVFTTDKVVVDKLYNNLEVGGMIVGDTNTFRIDTMPYGGVKDSGYGREGVEFAMREMSQIKVLVERQ